MAAPLVIAGLLATSTIVSIVGSRKAAKQEESARRRQAALLDEQAAEVVRRARVNADLIRDQGKRTSASQRVAFAEGGVDVGSGSALATQVDTILTANKIALKEKLNAERDADLIRMGADVQREVGAGARSAQKTSEIGTLLSGGASIAGAFKKG